MLINIKKIVKSQYNNNRKYQIIHARPFPHNLRNIQLIPPEFT